MKDSTPKEQILAKIRNALIETTTNPYPVPEAPGDVLKPANPQESPEVVFADMLIEAGGEFIYCENESALVDMLRELMHNRNWHALWCKNENLAQFLETAEIPFFKYTHDNEEVLVGITPCEKLISETGSIMISDTVAGGRDIISLPDVHLVVAFTTQVCTSLKKAFQDMRKKYPEAFPSLLTTITGPSRTADIEKTLVKGVHGPKEVMVFMIDDL